MATKEDVPRFVRELIAAEVMDDGGSHHRMSVDDITDHMRLDDDLGLDNLAIMSIVMALEARLDIAIPDHAFSYRNDFHGDTVGDLVNIVIGCMNMAGKS